MGTHQQLAFLSEKGCAEVQDYLFATRTPADDMQAWMANWDKQDLLARAVAPPMPRT